MKGRKRTRVAKGIYRDQMGFAVVATVGSASREKRFPFGSTLRELQRERDAIRTSLLNAVDRPARGTLASAAEKYLTLVAYLAPATLKSRRCEMAAWVMVYGSWPLGRITKAEVLTARNAWLAEHYAPKTINNRVGALRHLYHTLTSSKALTPCDDIRKLATVQQPADVMHPEGAKAVAMTLIERIQARQEDPKTLARFLVLTSTGVRPSELGRAEPEDVSLERGFWRIRTGKGGFRIPMPLNADMVAAWTYFLSANAWGHFDVSDYDKALYAAGWPTHVRPYNTRHTFGWGLSEAGVDLADIQQLLGHADIKTTRTHYVAPMTKRLAAATKAVDDRLGWSSLVLPSKE